MPAVKPAKKIAAKRKAPVKKKTAARKTPVRRKVTARKKGAGRPTKMTEMTVKKLEEAFLLGCTDIEACLYAGISKQTLYNYQEQVPEFIDRKEVLKANPVMKARKVLLDALDDDDRNIANKIIDRREAARWLSRGRMAGLYRVSTLL